jgi:hypothetical protein
VAARGAGEIERLERRREGYEDQSEQPHDTHLRNRVSRQAADRSYVRLPFHGARPSKIRAPPIVTISSKEGANMSIDSSSMTFETTLSSDNSVDQQ